MAMTRSQLPHPMSHSPVICGFCSDGEIQCAVQWLWLFGVPVGILIRGTMQSIGRAVEARALKIRIPMLWTWRLH